jgi:hypothetical protein
MGMPLGRSPNMRGRRHMATVGGALSDIKIGPRSSTHCERVD